MAGSVSLPQQYTALIAEARELTAPLAHWAATHGPQIERGRVANLQRSTAIDALIRADADVRRGVEDLAARPPLPENLTDAQRLLSGLRAYQQNALRAWREIAGADLLDDVQRVERWLNMGEMMCNALYTSWPPASAEATSAQHQRALTHSVLLQLQSSRANPDEGQKRAALEHVRAFVIHCVPYWMDANATTQAALRERLQEPGSDSAHAWLTAQLDTMSRVATEARGAFLGVPVAPPAAAVAAPAPAPTPPEVTRAREATLASLQRTKTELQDALVVLHKAQRDVPATLRAQIDKEIVWCRNYLTQVTDALTPPLRITVAEELAKSRRVDSDNWRHWNELANEAQRVQHAPHAAAAAIPRRERMDVAEFDQVEELMRAYGQMAMYPEWKRLRASDARAPRTEELRQFRTRLEASIGEMRSRVMTMSVREFTVHVAGSAWAIFDLYHGHHHQALRRRYMEGLIARVFSDRWQRDFPSDAQRDFLRLHTEVDVLGSDAARTASQLKTLLLSYGYTQSSSTEYFVKSVSVEVVAETIRKSEEVQGRGGWTADSPAFKRLQWLRDYVAEKRTPASVPEDHAPVDEEAECERLCIEINRTVQPLVEWRRENHDHIQQERVSREAIRIHDKSDAELLNECEDAYWLERSSEVRALLKRASEYVPEALAWWRRLLNAPLVNAVRRTFGPLNEWQWANHERFKQQSRIAHGTPRHKTLQARWAHDRELVVEVEATIERGKYAELQALLARGTVYVPIAITEWEELLSKPDQGME